jgi:hypothetical protein
VLCTAEAPSRYRTLRDLALSVAIKQELERSVDPYRFQIEHCSDAGIIRDEPQWGYMTLHGGTSRPRKLATCCRQAAVWGR